MENKLHKPKYRIDITVSVHNVEEDERDRQYSVYVRVPATLSVSVSANDLFEAVSVLDKVKLLVQS